MVFRQARDVVVPLCLMMAPVFGMEMCRKDPDWRLQMAVAYGEHADVQEALDAGANPNIIIWNLRMADMPSGLVSPLAKARDRGREDIVELLRARGAEDPREQVLRQQLQLALRKRRLKSCP